MKKESPAIHLGPIRLCVVITRDLTAAGNAYQTVMGMTRSAEFTLDASTAAALGIPGASGASACLLGNAAGRQWLLQVEMRDAQDRDALGSHGWMAQEILVEDVDALANTIAGTPFTLLRPPRDLDVSNTIRACQVRGPDGEILYLTQVNGEVEGSELPQGAQGVDHLFIAVLSAPDRNACLRHYEALAGGKGTCFDTRISVVNQHRGWDLERRHPIATVQLAGRTLIEIDELSDTAPAAQTPSAGTWSIAFIARTPAPDDALELTEGPLAGHRASAHVGTAGERFTLLYSSNA